MDWAYDELRDLTINVTFHSKGKPLFKITTWVLFVGVLTGMRFNQGGTNTGFSLSLNYRKLGESMLWNFLGAMAR